MLITGCQARMARAALKWTLDGLCRESGVGERTIRRIEAEEGVPDRSNAATLCRLRDAFEREGIRFIFEEPRGAINKTGAGVRRLVSVLASLFGAVKLVAQGLLEF